MTDGNWHCQVEGKGKIDPEAADEIQVLFKAFVLNLMAKGHTIKAGSAQIYKGW